MTKQALQIKDDLKRCVELNRAYQAVAHNLAGVQDITPADGLEDSLDAAAELAARRQELWNALCCTRQQGLERLRHAALPPLQYRILCLRYLRCDSWDEVVRKVEKSRRYVLALHTEALERVAASYAWSRDVNVS